MAKDKLEMLRRLAADRQQRMALELQKLRSQRLEQEVQSQSLREMLGSYKTEQLTAPSPDASQLAMFQRFYTRVTQTLSSHGPHLERLQQAEQQGERSFLDAYREYQAISNLQASRAAEKTRLRERKERRGDGARRWSMLNRTDDERDI